MNGKLQHAIVAAMMLVSLLGMAKASDPDPIHWYQMEEGVDQIGQSANGQTTVDSGSPGGNNGTIYGLTWAIGLNGTGACLDHERDNWGEAVDIPTLSSQITGSFTVEAYIKAESWAESWQNSIVSNLYTDGVQNYGFQLRAGARNDQEGWNPNNAVLGFVIGGRNDTTGTRIWQTLETSLYGPYLELGVEYHVVGAYDADTGEMSVYVDGIKRGSKTQMTTTQNSPEITEIGRDPLTAQRFDGLIDEVRIYDTILSNYSPGAGKASDPSPTDDVTNVSINTELSWTAGSAAVSHDVYFGTSSPGTFQGNQTAMIFDPGTLANNTTYYWRIDEVGPGGITAGDVWSFTTGAMPASDQKVGRNEVVEFSRISTSPYADPFNEIEVDVVFNKSGQTWRVPAFWGGGQEWKVRFAPPESGTYNYHWECTDTNNPDLNGHAGTLEVDDYQGTNKLLRYGHLKISENGRYFEHVNGTPFFWLADTWWKCLSYRLPWQDFRTLADDRSEKGFSAIQIVAGLYPEEPAFDIRGENEGGWVWEPNYTRINTGYFDYMDHRIQYLVDSELVPCIVGCWGYYIDTVQWNGMGVTKMKQHWRNLVARYGAYPVVWILAGEWNMPGDCGTISMTQRDGWIELIEYVKGIDPYHSPATLHEDIHRYTQPARVWVEDQSLVDFDLLQTGHGENTYYTKTVSSISATRSMIPAKPVVDGEVAYEGHTDRPQNNLYFNHDDDPPFPQRFLFWTSILQGAAGHTYGANGIWQVESPEYPHGWSGTCTNNNFWYTPWWTAMDFLGSTTLSLGKALLERYEWWRFEPRQDWVNPAGTSLTEPHDTWYDPVAYWNSIGGQHMLPYAAGIPGEVRMIYIPYGISPPQVLGIESEITYEAFYFNPLDGMEHDLGVVESTSGTWQAPSTPSSDLDWILVLEKQCSTDWFPVTEIGLSWVYHDVHGFNWLEYPSTICPDYAYIWNTNLGEWLLISANHINFIYRAEKDAWLYYGTGTAIGTGRWFYDYNQSQWVHESEL